MGMGAGGLMRQHIYEDENPFGVWQQDRAGRAFVHIANAELFTQITGMAPPPSPITAQDYSRAGLPWFDLYDADQALPRGLRAADRCVVDRRARRGEDRPRCAAIDHRVNDSQIVVLGSSRAGLDGEW